MKSGSTIVVPYDYLKIQDAINHAVAGDTVLVKAGTYVENVVVTKSISLISDTRRAATIETTSGNGITVEADGVQIRGFSIVALGVRPSDDSGIALHSTSNCYIFDNDITLHLGGTGILVDSGTKNTIIRSKIHGCGHYGIRLGGSYNNTVTRNCINTHAWSISLWNSNACLVSENWCFTHWDDDIFGLLWSHNNIVEGNTFCAEMGWPSHMDVWESTNNTLYHNNFEWESCIVAVSGSTGNVWDNGVEWNYWCEYDENDTNGDGVGDTDLRHNGLDSYPLIEPYFFLWLADVDDDYDVDIFDVVAVAAVYGSTPVAPDWNPDCDVAEPYYIIDIFDVVVVAKDYGATYPYFG